jgi:hypothetical protein
MSIQTVSDPVSGNAALSNFPSSLGLNAGDLVEIRSPEEILDTLDGNGKFEGMVFMPEMLQYCGKRFSVYKRAHKACDTIIRDGIRRLENSVHLDLRCDGSAHGGCQAECLIFWKEIWLKRITKIEQRENREYPNDIDSAWERLMKHTQYRDAADSSESRYSCQATELRKATKPLPWWNLDQYIQDVRSGNVRAGNILRSLAIRAFNYIQLKRGGTQYPLRFEWKLPTIFGDNPPIPKPKKTPHQTLDLQPGELVQIKSRDEILETLDDANKNRGLSFDREVVKYCGGTYRVRRRVDKLIDEKTGKMMSMKLPCIVLEGVICCGDYNQHCPRSIFPYWREIWLQRAQTEHLGMTFEKCTQPCSTAE